MSAPSPLVVIGGSAGALPALLELVPTLPPDFPAPVLIVVHTPADQPSYLPQVLNNAGPLPAQHARHGDPLKPGHIYCAPPDHHLLVAGDHLHLSRGPRENLARPAIDPLFRSAAQTSGSRVIGVLLSGMLNDGSSGLWTIKHLGGRTIVQNPEEAEYPEMPLSAVRQVSVDDILRARDLGPRLLRLLGEAVEPGSSDLTGEERRRLAVEVEAATGGNAFASGILNQGSPSTFTCPECHGVMMEIEEGKLTRFRCHTGHGFTAEALLSEMRHGVEESLWNVARALDEQVMLLEHLKKDSEQAQEEERAAGLGEEIRVTRGRAGLVRQIAQREGQGEEVEQ